MDDSSADLAGHLGVLAGSLLRADDPASVQALLPTRSFIELGGTSLLAMRLAARAAEELSVEVPIDLLLSSKPVQAALDGARATTVDLRPPTTGSGISSTASPSQRGMWAAEQLVGRPMYSLVVIAFLDGPLDAGRLDRAVGMTVARHEGLRTRFRLSDEGELERQVVTGWRPALVRGTAPGGPGFAEHVHATAASRASQPFDLAEGPPLRLLLLAGGTDQAALVLVTHHMLLDAWGIGLALREMFGHYHRLGGAGGRTDHADGPGTGPAPRLEVLLDRQRRLRESGELDRQAAFWASQLRDVPTVLDLPADRPRPLYQDPGGVRLAFDVGPAGSKAIRTRAAACGVTGFAHLLAAFGLLLARYTGHRRLLVGVPLAGRPGRALERLVGHCAAVVPVVIDVDEDATADDYVRAVQRSLTASMTHADLPIDELVRRFAGRGDASRNPLVHVVCGMYDGVIESRLRVGELAVRIVEGHAGTAPMDLTLAVQRAEPGFGGTLEYATGVWTRAEAAGFLADLLALTAELATASGRVEDLRGVAPARRELLDRLHRTAQPYPETSIERLFVAQARRSPDATAVRDGDTTLSYRDLERASAAQAAALAAAGVRPGDTVAVGVDRSAGEVVAVLGVLRAGAAYLSVDASLPESRLEHLLRKAAPSAAVAEPALAQALRRAGVTVVPAWRGSASDVDGPAGRPYPVPAGDADRIAYVAFTSGSTGEPKGVRVTHRGVVRLVHGADYVRLGPGTRFLRFAPLRCDPSTLEIWGPLLTGGEIEVHPPGVPSPGELGEFIATRGITALLLMSGAFRLLAEFTPESFARVGQLVTGGEVIPPDHVAAVLARNPGLSVTNGYGPTENTLFTTVHTVSDLDAVQWPLPIGLPIANTRVYLLDDRHRLLPPGAVGELYAAGDGLAAGYVGDEAETARQFGRFSPDVDERLYRTGDLARLDSAGRVQFLGRRDDQVKISGFRVEPEEVRRTLCELPGVDDAFVLATDAFGPDRQLVAAFVPGAPDGDLTGRLAEFVASRLPRYMVPASWVPVPAIPITATGKVDRDALIEAVGKGRPRQEQ